MKKAKIVKGIRVKFNTGDNYIEARHENFPYVSKEELMKKQLGIHPLLAEKEDVTDIEIIAKDLILYEVVSCQSTNLEPNRAAEFRKNIGKPNFYKNSRYLTKKEIEQDLKNGYCIAVKGLGEINSIEEVGELEFRLEDIARVELVKEA